MTEKVELRVSCSGQEVALELWKDGMPDSDCRVVLHIGQPINATMVRGSSARGSFLLSTKEGKLVLAKYPSLGARPQMEWRIPGDGMYVMTPTELKAVGQVLTPFADLTLLLTAFGIPAHVLVRVEMIPKDGRPPIVGESVKMGVNCRAFYKVERRGRRPRFRRIDCSLSCTCQNLADLLTELIFEMKLGYAYIQALIGDARAAAEWIAQTYDIQSMLSVQSEWHLDFLEDVLLLSVTPKKCGPIEPIAFALYETERQRNDAGHKLALELLLRKHGPNALFGPALTDDQLALIEVLQGSVEQRAQFIRERWWLTKVHSPSQDLTGLCWCSKRRAPEEPAFDKESARYAGPDYPDSRFGFRHNGALAVLFNGSQGDKLFEELALNVPASHTLRIAGTYPLVHTFLKRDGYLVADMPGGTSQRLGPLDTFACYRVQVLMVGLKRASDGPLMCVSDDALIVGVLRDGQLAHAVAYDTGETPDYCALWLPEPPEGQGYTHYVVFQQKDARGQTYRQVWGLRRHRRPSQTNSGGSIVDFDSEWKPRLEFKVYPLAGDEWLYAYVG